MICLFFDPIANQWSYKYGSDNIDAISTTSASGFNPGIRTYCSSTVLKNDSILIFGGYGYTLDNSTQHGDLDELIRYEPNEDKFYFISGNDTFFAPGIYDSPNPYPGAREDAAFATIENGSVLLFGGYSYYDQDIGGYFWDLWRYEPSTNMWYVAFGDGDFDIKGYNRTDGTGWPSSRATTNFAVLSNGLVFLYGGVGIGGDSYRGNLNDLWTYDPLNNAWYFLLGNDTIDAPEYIGFDGVGIPYSRYGFSIVVSNDSVILFGGQLSVGYTLLMNDLYHLKICTCFGFCPIYDNFLNSMEPCYDCFGSYFGKNCESCYCDIFNGFCDDGINGTGLCFECVSDRFGPNCTEPCTCVNGPCFYGINGTGTCKYCNANAFGPNCSQICTCVNGVCNNGTSGNGTCKSCSPNYMGTNCNVLIPATSSLSIVSTTDPSTQSQTNSSSTNASSQPITTGITTTRTSSNTGSGVSTQTENNQNQKLSIPVLSLLLLFLYFLI